MKNLSLRKITAVVGKVIGTLLVLVLGIFLFSPENLYRLFHSAKSDNGDGNHEVTPAAVHADPIPAAPPRELATVGRRLDSVRGSIDQQTTTMTGSPDSVRAFWKNKLLTQGCALLPDSEDTIAVTPICAFDDRGMILVEFKPLAESIQVTTRHFRQMSASARPVEVPEQLRYVSIGTPFMNYRSDGRLPIYSSTTSLNLGDAARLQEEKFRKNSWEVPAQAVKMSNGSYLLTASSGKLYCNVVFSPGNEETRGMNTVTYQLTQ